MSTERIRELVELMEAHELVVLEVDEKDFKVHLERERTVVVGTPMLPMPISAASGGVAATAMGGGITAPAEAGLLTVTSPIVGTFYAAPTPDAAPFVKEGDSIQNDSVVCIIEAMKIMNEIPAEISGTIVEILAENGQPVEFGQELFRVRPA